MAKIQVKRKTQRRLTGGCGQINVSVLFEFLISAGGKPGMGKATVRLYIEDPPLELGSFDTTEFELVDSRDKDKSKALHGLIKRQAVSYLNTRYVWFTWLISR